jgi:hypothetical protein
MSSIVEQFAPAHLAYRDGVPYVAPPGPMFWAITPSERSVPALWLDVKRRVFMFLPDLPVVPGTFDSESHFVPNEP